MKKGLEFLSNRIVVSIILIIIQIIAILIFAYTLFIDLWVFKIIFMMLSLLVVLYIINKDDDPSYKIIWLVPILSFPVFGGVLYLTFGNKKPAKKLQIAFDKQSKATNPYIYPNHVLEEIADPIIKGQIKYLVNENFPVYNNSEIKYYSLGEEAYLDLLEELAKAKHFIFMEYFIVEEGYMLDQILEILIQKVREGVEVRFMYDGMCAISMLPYDYPEKLKHYGIQCKMANAVKPFLSTTQNNRDHRKICVIDGKTAFTGGINIGDEYINRKERFGHWKDTAIMLKGDAVQSFTMMFLEMWNVDERYSENYHRYLTPKRRELHREYGYIIPYADSPYDDENVGEEVYFHILNHARKYVHIMTPYLILDNEMITTLTRVAKSGVEVSIIMPHIPDKWYAFAVAKTYYKELIEGGVRIYEYEPGFVHAKVFVADDDTASVGTINLDYRSLYLHFECGAFIYNNSEIDRIERDFQETLEKCHKVTLMEVKNRSLLTKIVGQVLKLVAPLM